MQIFLTSIGHILGFISVGLFFYSYQCTEKRKLMVVQTIATALSCVQYLLIGAVSGFALNIVCIIRNLAFYYRDKYKRTGLAIPVIFSLCMAVVSVFSWEGVHSLLITAGLFVNTMCMGIFDAKTYSGILSESISLVSVVIGIIRYNRPLQKSVKIQANKKAAA